MFIRHTIHIRRNEFLAKDDPNVTLTEEHLYSDDMVGELGASDNAHKLTDRAIDALFAEEEKRKTHE